MRLPLKTSLVAQSSRHKLRESRRRPKLTLLLVVSNGAVMLCQSYKTLLLHSAVSSSNYFHFSCLVYMCSLAKERKK